MKPTPRAVIIMTENCSSFMPMLSARGFRMGARITILGVVSMTHPAAMRIAIISRIRIAGFSVIEVTE